MTADDRPMNCKGSLLIGTGCGSCPRCDRERAAMAGAVASPAARSPGDAEVLARLLCLAFGENPDDAIDVGYVRYSPRDTAPIPLWKHKYVTTAEKMLAAGYAVETVNGKLGIGRPPTAQ